MEDKAKITLTIDGNEVTTTEGATILDAARQNGIYIPTLCHHPAVSNWGGCRMCVVEVDGAPKLVASCVMPVRPGMTVVTTSEKILESRRTVLEFLFAERNHNCMFCPQSGDCALQNLAYELKMDHLGMEFAFEKFPTDTTSEHMVMDHNRCVLCGRCVRACSELAGNFVLHFQNRGSKSLIGMDLDESREASTCVGCGLCMQLCPTGAISNRYRAHYAVKGHAKDWKEVESSCPECGLLCPTVSRVRDAFVLRIEGDPSRQDGRPDRGQLCYRGRFEVLRSRGKRLLRPLVKNGSGEWKEESWEKALSLVAAGLKGKKRVFGLASSSGSNEELMLFRDLIRKGWGAEYADTLDGDAYRDLLSVWNERAKGFREASWKAIPQADMILVLSGDPHRSQPLIASLIRRGVMEKGTKVACLGQAGELPQPLVQSISPAPGKEMTLARAFLKAVSLSKGSWPKEVEKRIAATIQGTVKAMLKESGIDEKGRAEFDEAVKSFAASKNPLVIAGAGADPAVLGCAVDLALLKGPLPKDTLRIVVLKPRGNSAGAWSLGVASGKEETGKGRWQGGFLLLARDGDLTPDQIARWGRPDFLAVLSPYIPEGIAAKTAVLIPAPEGMEAEGTYTSLDGAETSFRKRTINPPSGVRSAWETLLGLAKLSGVEPGLKDLGEATRRAAEESKKGCWS